MSRMASSMHIAQKKAIQTARAIVGNPVMADPLVC